MGVCITVPVPRICLGTPEGYAAVVQTQHRTTTRVPRIIPSTVTAARHQGAQEWGASCEARRMRKRRKNVQKCKKKGARRPRGRPELVKMCPEGPGRPKCCFFDDFWVPPGGPWRHQNRQVGPQNRKKSLQSRVKHACKPERCKFSVAGSIFTCFGGQNWIKNCVFLDAFGKV